MLEIRRDLNSRLRITKDWDSDHRCVAYWEYIDDLQFCIDVTRVRMAASLTNLMSIKKYETAVLLRTDSTLISDVIDIWPRLDWMTTAEAD